MFVFVSNIHFSIPLFLFFSFCSFPVAFISTFTSNPPFFNALCYFFFENKKLSFLFFFFFSYFQLFAKFSWKKNFIFLSFFLLFLFLFNLFVKKWLEKKGKKKQLNVYLLIAVGCRCFVAVFWLLFEWKISEDEKS